MATYGYCRVSTMVQAEDGESLEVQRRQIQGRAMQEGWILSEIFVERAVSGARPFGDREQGSALLARLQPGDVIVAAKLDRMFRSALDALQTCDRFQRNGVSLYLLDLGGDVTSNGIAGLFMKIAAAFAEFERDRLRERIRDVKTDQRKRGLHLGGHRPFGYRVDADRRLVPDPKEQAAIARIKELRRTGLSLRQIARTVHGECGVTVQP
jgi:putative DNA-invertase from lambdoid prophage Rac